MTKDKPAPGVGRRMRTASGRKRTDPRDPDVMTVKEQRFVELYLANPIGAKAARGAGYPAKQAKAMAYQLLHETPRVMKAIEEGRARLAEKAQLSAERVLEELRRVAFANAGDFFEWGPDGIRVRPQADLTREQMAAVAEVSETATQFGGTVRVKLHDKLTALGKLGQHFGLFAERHEITGRDGGPIETADVSDQDLARRIAFILTQATQG